MSKKDKKPEFLNVDSTIYKTNLSKKYREREAYQPADISKVKCFIPGTIVEICVEVGDEVKEGQNLVILEAMKMKNEIQAESSGVVTRLLVEKDQAVEGGDPLFEIGQA